MKALKNGIPISMQARAKAEANRLANEVYNTELKRAIDNAFKETQLAVTAQVLYCMWKNYGWGRKRCLRLQEELFQQSEWMTKQCNVLDAADARLFCTELLRQAGIELKDIDGKLPSQEG